MWTTRALHRHCQRRSKPPNKGGHVSAQARHEQGKQARPTVLIPDSNPTPPSTAPAIISSVCRLQPFPPSQEPIVTVQIQGKPVSALLDSGASISLIGDDVFKQCQRKCLRFRDSTAKVQMASGITATTKGGARLCASLTSKKHRQRFVYLP